MPVDARPSDAIALALRTQLADLRARTCSPRPPRSVGALGERGLGRLQKWLEGLSDDELGKYKM